MPTFHPCTLLTLCAFGALHAEVIQVPWDGLPALVQGRTVKMVAMGGPVITARVTGVEADTLAINVTRTSDRRLCPKGVLRVPRAAVRTLQLQTKGSAWRILGTLGGAAAGFVGGAGAAIAIDWHDNHNSAATAAFTGALVGGAVAGYFAGNAADSKWTLVRVLPDR